jgi:hypothetical protein
MSRKSHPTVDQQIDSLDEAKTVGELVARLKPILHQLSYYVTIGEGAVSEAHEEWHDEFTNRLYDAAGADFQEAQVKQSARKVTEAKKQEERPQKPMAKLIPRDAPKNRPAKSNISPSLLAIMNGSHESLKEED